MAFALAFFTLGGTAFAVTVDMIADGGDEKIDVGDVTVVLDYPYFDVTFTTVDGWLMNETHVHVFFQDYLLGGDLIGIRLKNGNPAPGKFDFKHEDLGGVTSDMYDDEINVLDLGDILVDPGLYDIFVAAHAEVQKQLSMEVCSDGDETFEAVSGPGTVGNPNITPVPPRSGTAVAAWQHSTWITNVNPLFSCGTWIWESNRVVDPIFGTVVDFSETFNIPGPPVGGTLKVTTDNGYEAYLNGDPLGDDGLSGAWRTSDLTESYVTTAMSAWSSVESLDLTGSLQEGDNALDFATANEYMNPDDPGNPVGTVDSNPGGLIYEALIDYLREETAWGGTKGPEPDYDLSIKFPGKNWAIYFHSGVLFYVPEPFSAEMLGESEVSDAPILIPLDAVED